MCCVRVWCVALLCVCMCVEGVGVGGGADRMSLKCALCRQILISGHSVLCQCTHTHTLSLSLSHTFEELTGLKVDIAHSLTLCCSVVLVLQNEFSTKAFSTNVCTIYLQ